MDLERIEKVVQLFAGSRARELVVEADEWRVSMLRGATPVTSVASRPAAEPVVSITEPETDAGPTLAVTAPLVGIFRQSNGRIGVGDLVRADEEVGSIESMKILNPVVAAAEGQVIEVLIEDGQPVEFGQPLYLLEPRPSETES